MVLALLSPTPITRQHTGIPACKRAFQVTWVYQNLEMLALEQAGRTLGRGDQTMDQVTRQLLAVLQRCLSGGHEAGPGRARAGAAGAADTAHVPGAIIPQHIDPVCCCQPFVICNFRQRTCTVLCKCFSALRQHACKSSLTRRQTFCLLCRLPPDPLHLLMPQVAWTL
jgi:hypothetical protein